MRILLALMMLAIALNLSACGKRARYLDPPDANAPHYPKSYPPKDDPGTHL
jgi:predicted small lipoprotein YifL